MAVKEGTTADKNWLLRWSGLLLCVTVLAYLPAFGAGYIWDDGGYVQYNPTLRSLGGLWQIWFKFGATQDYYPLTFTTFWLEYRLWGLAPAGFHAVNILLHAGNAILLSQLLTRLRVPGAMLAAAVFALHPVHVESVAWITERKNVLSGLFFLLALYAFLRFEDFHAEQPDPSRRRWWYAASLGCFLLAMLSKTVTVTLPFVLPVINWWQRGRLTWRDLAVSVPYIALAVPIFGLSSLAGANFGGAGVPITGSTGGLWDFSLAEKFIIAGRCLWFYPLKLFLPVGLSFVYPRFDIDGGVWWQYLFPLTAFSVPLVFVLMSTRWGRGPVAAVLFFGLTLAPASGFFSFYFQRYSFVADHLQYLASAGLIALVVGAAVSITQRLRPLHRHLIAVGGALMLLLLGTLTFRQCFVYDSLETLWRDTLHKYPDCEMAHTNLGLLLSGENRLAEAMEHLERARDIAPQEAVVYNNLGTVFMLQHEPAKAIEQFEHALAIYPAHADSCSNLGMAYLTMGRQAEGLKRLEKAVELAPQQSAVQFNLAATLHQLGRLDEAVFHYQAASESNPLHFAALYNLATIYRQQGKQALAADLFRRAEQIEATNPYY